MGWGWDGATHFEPAPLLSLLERQVHGLEPKVQTRQRPRQCKTYTDMVMGFLLLLGIGRVAILRKQLIGYLAIPLLLVHQIWMLQQVVLLLPMLDCLMEEVSFLYTLLLLFCFIHLHSFDDYHYMIMQLHVASIYSDFLDKVGSSIKPQGYGIFTFLWETQQLNDMKYSTFSRCCEFLESQWYLLMVVACRMTEDSTGRVVW